MNCPKCDSRDVVVQTFQENKGEKTVTKTKSTYQEKKHGCLYWLFIGWWIWIFDLFLWLFLFIPRVLIHIGRKRKYKSKSRSVSKTTNDIGYKTLCVCQDCGYQWEI